MVYDDISFACVSASPIKLLSSCLVVPAGLRTASLVTRCTMIHASRGRVYCRESIGQHRESPIAAEGEHFSLKFRGERNWATRTRAVKATTPSEIPKTSARYIGFKVPRLGVIERRLIKKEGNRASEERVLDNASFITEGPG